MVGLAGVNVRVISANSQWACFLRNLVIVHLDALGLHGYATVALCVRCYRRVLQTVKLVLLLDVSIPAKHSLFRTGIVACTDGLLQLVMRDLLISTCTGIAFTLEISF